MKVGPLPPTCRINGCTNQLTAKKKAEEAWSNSPDYDRASGGY